MSESKITIDRATFKALASDTRLDILKLLDKRQMTVSELGRALNLNKATCFEHLSKLVEAGLVNKLEDDRKWVYYQLTWKGRRILNPEKITIALLLSSSFAALVTGIVTLWLYAQGTIREITGGDTGGGDVGIQRSPEGFAEADPSMAAPAPMTEVIHDPTLLVVGIALFVLTVVLVGLGIATWRKAKAQPIA